MDFWKLAFDRNWVSAEQLKKIVITDTNKFGEIAIEQYKQITKLDFA